VAEEEKDEWPGISGGANQYATPACGTGREHTEHTESNMKAVKRWAWNIFCALSLLIFAMSLTLWVKSYFVVDLISYIRPRTAIQSSLYGIESSRGALGIYYVQAKGTLPKQDTPGCHYYSYRAAPGDNSFASMHGPLAVRHQVYKGLYQTLDFRFVIIPSWFFFPAAVPPLLWWRKWKKNRGRGFPIGVASAVEESRDREVREDAKTAAKD